MSFIPHPIAEMSRDEIIVASEKGRLMAARELASDSSKRRDLEDKWGVDLMMKRYPEIYWGGFGNLLDRIKPLR